MIQCILYAYLENPRKELHRYRSTVVHAHVTDHSPKYPFPPDTELDNDT